jgi:hypothetical protein
MKRLLTLIALAAVTAGPAVAQNLPTNAAAQRQTIDTAAIARALQDRGIPDDQIAASMPRIRYWLSLGASPARIRAFLNQQNGNTRPDLPGVAARPETPVARGPIVVRPDAEMRPVTPVARGPIVARPNNVQSVDTVRISPRTVRPSVTQPLAGN